VRGSIAAADVDGDGNLDVLLGNLDVLLGNDGSPSRVLLRNNGSPGRVLLNAGDGTFPTSITLPRGSAITCSIAAADVDGDLDVLLANGGSPLFARGSRRPTYEAVACASWLVREHRLDAGLAARVARLVVAARVDPHSHCNRWAIGRACVSSE
jgi:hypothetical protein